MVVTFNVDIWLLSTYKPGEMEENGVFHIGYMCFYFYLFFKHKPEEGQKGVCMASADPTVPGWSVCLFVTFVL